MPKFLSREEIYRIIQRELPEGVYPDGAPSAYWSTAESDASAAIAASAYMNLERIYENYFPQTADERIADWEVTMLGAQLDASLGLTARRDQVIAKWREQNDLSLWTILTRLLTLVSEGVHIQLFENCRIHGGGWELGVSELGVGTILGNIRTIDIASPEEACFPDFPFWTLGESELGVETTMYTDGGDRDIDEVLSEEFGLQQYFAYSYEIRIFEHVLTTAQRDAIERVAKQLQPARSTHIIRDDLEFLDFGLTTIVTDVGRFSGVDCVKVDPASETGFSGRTE